MQTLIRHWKIAFFLFLFSVATHLPGITHPLLDFHSWAQTLRASVARNYFESNMNLFAPQLDYDTTEVNKAPQLPLYSYLIAIGYKIFGEHDYLGRILAAFFAACSTVIFFAVLLEYTTESAAFLSALFYCLIPVRIYFLRAVMPESLALLFLLLSIYSLQRWKRSGRFGWIICSSLFISGVILTKLPYWPFLLLPIYLLHDAKLNDAKLHDSKLNDSNSQNSKQENFWSLFKRKEIYILVGLAVTLPAAWYAFVNFGSARFQLFSSGLLSEVSPYQSWTRWDFWHRQFISRFPEVATTYAGLILWILGAKECFQKKQILWLWMLLGFGYIFLCGEYGYIHVYSWVPVALPIAAWMGEGLQLIRTKLTPKNHAMANQTTANHSTAKRTAVTLFFLFAVALHAGLRIRHWYSMDDETWIYDAQKIVWQVSAPTDRFYIDAFDQPYFLYHLRRKGNAGLLDPIDANFLEQARLKNYRFLFVPGPLGIAEKISPETAPFLKLIYNHPQFKLYNIQTSK